MVTNVVENPIEPLDPEVPMETDQQVAVAPTSKNADQRARQNKPTNEDLRPSSSSSEATLGASRASSSRSLVSAQGARAPPDGAGAGVPGPQVARERQKEPVDERIPRAPETAPNSSGGSTSNKNGAIEPPTSEARKSEVLSGINRETGAKISLQPNGQEVGENSAGQPVLGAEQSLNQPENESNNVDAPNMGQEPRQKNGNKSSSEQIDDPNTPSTSREQTGRVRGGTSLEQNGPTDGAARSSKPAVQESRYVDISIPTAEEKHVNQKKPDEPSITVSEKAIIGSNGKNSSSQKSLDSNLPSTSDGRRGNAGGTSLIPAASNDEAGQSFKSKAAVDKEKWPMAAKNQDLSIQMWKTMWKPSNYPNVGEKQQKQLKRSEPTPNDTIANRPELEIQRKAQKKNDLEKVPPLVGIVPNDVARDATDRGIQPVEVADHVSNAEDMENGDISFEGTFKCECFWIGSPKRDVVNGNFKLYTDQQQSVHMIVETELMPRSKSMQITEAVIRFRINVGHEKKEINCIGLTFHDRSILAKKNVMSMETLKKVKKGESTVKAMDANFTLGLESILVSRGGGIRHADEKKEMKEFLQSRGVKFGPGSNITHAKMISFFFQIMNFENGFIYKKPSLKFLTDLRHLNVQIVEDMIERIEEIESSTARVTPTSVRKRSRSRVDEAIRSLSNMAKNEGEPLKKQMKSVSVSTNELETPGASSSVTEPSAPVFQQQREPTKPASVAPGASSSTIVVTKPKVPKVNVSMIPQMRQSIPKQWRLNFEALNAPRNELETPGASSSSKMARNEGEPPKKQMKPVSAPVSAPTNERETPGASSSGTESSAPVVQQQREPTTPANAALGVSSSAIMVTKPKLPEKKYSMTTPRRPCPRVPTPIRLDSEASNAPRNELETPGASSSRTEPSAPEASPKPPAEPASAAQDKKLGDGSQ